LSLTPKKRDTCFEDDLLNLVAAKTLLIVDRGFYHFLFWSQLQSKGVDVICRLKAGAAYTVEHTFTDRAGVKDLLIRLGVKRKGAPQLQMRLVQVKFGSVWYSYITTVVEPERLPPYVVADLYRRRWRIEEAFSTVKRLLGLSYLWTGSINGVQLLSLGYLVVLRSIGGPGRCRCR
jgi:IS4 transposase